MKVTRLIREYVEEQVGKVYDAKVNPYTEQANIDRQTIEAFEKDLKKQQIDLIEKFLSGNELFEDTWNGVRRKGVCTSIPRYTSCLTQAMLNEKEWANENKRAKNAKVRDIIVSLELGATRHELNDMISKLLEEEST